MNEINGEKLREELAPYLEKESENRDYSIGTTALIYGRDESSIEKLKERHDVQNKLATAIDKHAGKNHIIYIDEENPFYENMIQAYVDLGKEVSVVDSEFESYDIDTSLGNVHNITDSNYSRYSDVYIINDDSYKDFHKELLEEIALYDGKLLVVDVNYHYDSDQYPSHNYPDIFTHGDKLYNTTFDSVNFYRIYSSTMNITDRMFVAAGETLHKVISGHRVLHGKQNLTLSTDTGVFITAHKDDPHFRFHFRDTGHISIIDKWGKVKIESHGSLNLYNTDNEAVLSINHYGEMFHIETFLDIRLRHWDWQME